MQAWHKFEQSRIAVYFRAELEANEPLFDDDASDFQELINWFKRDHDMLSLVRTDLLGTIGRFGEATFALGREEHDAKVQAITVEVELSHRTRIYPMVGPQVLLISTGCLEPGKSACTTLKGSRRNSRVIAQSGIYLGLYYVPAKDAGP